MTAARRLAAILAVDFMGTRASWARSRRRTARRFANIRDKMFPTRSL